MLKLMVDTWEPILGRYRARVGHGRRHREACCACTAARRACMASRSSCAWAGQAAGLAAVSMHRGAGSLAPVSGARAEMSDVMMDLNYESSDDELLESDDAEAKRLVEFCPRQQIRLKPPPTPAGFFGLLRRFSNSRGRGVRA